MASKSLFDFIENNKSVPVKKTEQAFLFAKEVDIPNTPPKIIKNVTVLNNVYEVSIE